MNPMELLKGIGFVALLAVIGLTLLVKPQWLWKAEEGLWSQEGTPSGLYLSVLRVGGGMLLALTILGAVILTVEQFIG